MSISRRYTTEHVFFVLDLLVKRVPRNEIVDAFNKKFNATGKLGFEFGPKQVKYIKAAYGKHPDYGYPFLTEADKKWCEENPETPGDDDRESQAGELDSIHGDARLQPLPVVSQPSASRQPLPPIQLISSAAGEWPSGAATYIAQDNPLWGPSTIQSLGAEEAGDHLDQAAGKGKRAVSQQGDAWPPPPSIAPAGIQRPDSATTQGQGTWTYTHPPCLIADAHRHNSDGSVTFQTMAHFLSSHKKLRDLTLRVGDRAVGSLFRRMVAENNNMAQGARIAANVAIRGSPQQHQSAVPSIAQELPRPTAPMATMSPVGFSTGTASIPPRQLGTSESGTKSDIRLAAAYLLLLVVQQC
ncbi:hypothetical protein GQ53DRAFT_882029 [Thozetella sp. PMI_491]|nr:hypothetical protein GQ53DRAFT_882029 [Thozetella sp. PMI_491]